MISLVEIHNENAANNKEIQTITKRLEWLKTRQITLMNLAKEKPSVGSEIDKVASGILIIEGDWATAVIRYPEANEAMHNAIHEISEPTCGRLSSEYIGCKRYDRWPCQKSYYNYGYGPSHGHVWLRVGLKSEFRKKQLEQNEVGACVSYLNALLFKNSD